MSYFLKKRCNVYGPAQVQAAAVSLNERDLADAQTSSPHRKSLDEPPLKKNLQSLCSSSCNCLPTPIKSFHSLTLNSVLTPSPALVCFCLPACLSLLPCSPPPKKHPPPQPIMAAIEKLSKTHAEHISQYGTGNEQRLTGKHETCDINTFR